MTPINPHDIATKRMTLAHQYSDMSDEMAVLEQNEAKYIFGEREKYKSDKQTQMAWDVTDEGQRLIFLKRKCKGMEKELGALSSFINVANNQARNLY